MKLKQFQTFLTYKWLKITLDEKKKKKKKKTVLTRSLDFANPLIED